MKFTATFDYKGKEHKEPICALDEKTAKELIGTFYPNSKHVKVKQINVLWKRNQLLTTKKISEIKKQKFRKVIWYFYGVIFTLSDLVNLIKKEELNFIFLTQMIVGLLF